MKLSMLLNKEDNNIGFTIVELVIVIAGLSILIIRYSKYTQYPEIKQN